MAAVTGSVGQEGNSASSRGWNRRPSLRRGRTSGLPSAVPRLGTRARPESAVGDVTINEVTTSSRPTSWKWSPLRTPSALRRRVLGWLMIFRYEIGEGVQYLSIESRTITTVQPILYCPAVQYQAFGPRTWLLFEALLPLTTRDRYPPTKQLLSCGLAHHSWDSQVRFPTHTW